MIIAKSGTDLESRGSRASRLHSIDVNLCAPNKLLGTLRNSGPQTDFVSSVTFVFQLINEKSARFLEHFVEFLSGHFTDRLKAHSLFHREKSLRTNEAGLTDLAAFTIAVIQWNGESIPVRATRDLAEN